MVTTTVMTWTHLFRGLSVAKVTRKHVHAVRPMLWVKRKVADSPSSQKFMAHTKRAETLHAATAHVRQTTVVFGVMTISRGSIEHPHGFPSF
jgi:hypothetical protein